MGEGAAAGAVGILAPVDCNILHGRWVEAGVDALRGGKERRDENEEIHGNKLSWDNVEERFFGA